MATTELVFELESDIEDTADWGKIWFVNFNAGKSQLVWFEESHNSDTIDVKMDWSVLEEKSYFKMLEPSFSSKLGWDSYIVCVAKTSSKKIVALICSMKFLSPQVALYKCKSAIGSYMENHGHV